MNGYVEAVAGPYKGRAARVLDEPQEGLARLRDELGIFIVQVKSLVPSVRYYLGTEVRPVEGLVEAEWAPLEAFPYTPQDAPEKWPEEASWPPPKGWVAGEIPDRKGKLQTCLFWKDQLCSE